MFSFFKKRIICPYCLAEIRGGGKLKQCPKCKNELPPLYLNKYENHKPFFVQVFGWSRVGKSVYLQALTLMLTKMPQIWTGVVYIPTTEPTKRILQDINIYLARKGEMPAPTQLSLQEAYIMVMDKIPRWGGRTLVMRDCAGEHFDNLVVPVEQAPYLLNVPVTFMFISLYDLYNSDDGRSINLLMTNYINTLLREGVNFDKEQRKIVVVLTKGDIIPNLPANLRNYLRSDPLWAAVNSPHPQPMDNLAIQEYLESMARVGEAIRDWLQQTPEGKVFINFAEDNNIELRFSIISSTGGQVGEGNTMSEGLQPRRVLDPYFWALELQSY